MGARQAGQLPPSPGAPEERGSPCRPGTAGPFLTGGGTVSEAWPTRLGEQRGTHAGAPLSAGPRVVDLPRGWRWAGLGVGVWVAAGGGGGRPPWAGPAVSLGTPTPETRLVRKRSHQQRGRRGPEGTGQPTGGGAAPLPSSSLRPCRPCFTSSAFCPAPRRRLLCSPARLASRLCRSSSETSAVPSAPPHPLQSCLLSGSRGGEALGSWACSGEGSPGTLSGRIRASAEYREGRRGAGGRTGHSGPGSGTSGEGREDPAARPLAALSPGAATCGLACLLVALWGSLKPWRALRPGCPCPRPPHLQNPAGRRGACPTGTPQFQVCLRC